MKMSMLTMLTMINKIKSSNDPMAMASTMFNNNPLFQRAVEMTKGKSNEEVQATVYNIAKQVGVSEEQVHEMLNSFGIKE